MQSNHFEEVQIDFALDPVIEDKTKSSTHDQAFSLLQPQPKVIRQLRLKDHWRWTSINRWAVLDGHAHSVTRTRRIHLFFNISQSILGLFER